MVGLVCCVVCSGPWSWPAAAADEPEKTEAKPEEKKPSDSGKEAEKPSKPEEKHVETRHSITINGQRISYTAVAGTILLRDAEEKPTASIFYIAYTKDGVTNYAKRPLTFSFNGGPGSSSVWLHLGLLGPRRVLLQEDGSALPPPCKWADTAGRAGRCRARTPASRNSERSRRA